MLGREGAEAESNLYSRPPVPCYDAPDGNMAIDPHPVQTTLGTPGLPDLMVMEMSTLGLYEPGIRDQYPNIPDNAVIVLVKGWGVRRVDDDYDS